jgi:hypothetical protein
MAMKITRITKVVQCSAERTGGGFVPFVADRVVIFVADHLRDRRDE